MSANLTYYEREVFNLLFTEAGDLTHLYKRGMPAHEARHIADTHPLVIEHRVRRVLAGGAHAIDLTDRYVPGMTVAEAKELRYTDPREVAHHVHLILGAYHDSPDLMHLYKPGMTVDEARNIRATDPHEVKSLVCLILKGYQGTPDCTDRYKPGMTVPEAEEIRDTDPREVEWHARDLLKGTLGKPDCSDRYKPGMTVPEANLAYANDPRVVEWHARDLLKKKGLDTLYKGGMTVDEAVKVGRHYDQEVLPQVLATLQNSTVGDVSSQYVKGMTQVEADQVVSDVVQRRKDRVLEVLRRNPWGDCRYLYKAGMTAEEAEKAARNCRFHTWWVVQSALDDVGKGDLFDPDMSIEEAYRLAETPPHEMKAHVFSILANAPGGDRSYLYTEGMTETEAWKLALKNHEDEEDEVRETLQIYGLGDRYLPNMTVDESYQIIDTDPRAAKQRVLAALKYSYGADCTDLYFEGMTYPETSIAGDDPRSVKARALIVLKGSGHKHLYVEGMSVSEAYEAIYAAKP